LVFYHPDLTQLTTQNMSVPPSRARPLDRLAARKTVKPVNFICMAAEAKFVSLVGDFNEWQPHATPMKRQPDGCWLAQVQLGPGHHHYQFLVDGKPTLDPRAQGIARNQQGQKVSLIAVG
jgi:1,4-alpha-glucan branching enzyme